MTCRIALAPALLALALGCSGWLVTESEAALAPLLPDPAYEQLFDHYVELCAVSQYRSLEYGEGGVPGHAVMYLKGACRDEQAPIPALRPCRGSATRLDDPEHGAGISVNRWLQNANWLATPGTRLFFDGNLREGERVDRASFDRALRAALEAGLLRGVQLRADAPLEGGLEELVARHFLGTDFALRMARTVFCARLPVTDEMMGDIIDYLNAINAEYASGRADYDWSGLGDNCAHLLHNALAAASIWRPRSVGASKTRQLFHLSVPANEVIDLIELGAEGPLANGRDVYRNDEARDALLDFDWLPRHHGSLVTVLPVWTPNELFETQARILVLQGPLSRRAGRTGRRLAEDPRFNALRPNLEHFREVYAQILRERDELIAGGFLPLRSVRYLRPTKRYYGYVERQLAEVEAMLAQLEGAGAP
jgi:hypothetical protein